MKLEKCALCGGKIREEKSTYELHMNNDVYVIKSVPMEACTQCSEKYLSPKTSKKIDEIKRKIKADEIKLVRTGSTYEAALA